MATIASLKRELAALGIKSAPAGPGYLSVDSLEEIPENLPRGTKVYIGWSPDEWDDDDTSQSAA